MIRHRVAIHRVPDATATESSTWPCRMSIRTATSQNLRDRGTRRDPLRVAAKRAFTLLEVVLSLALFFGALAALSQLTWNASRAAVQSRLRTQAVLLCETKLNEVVAGIEPLSSQSNVSYADDPNWTWSLNVGASQSPYPELLLLEVTVSHTAGGALGNVSQTLRRWFRDPQVYIDAAAQQAEIDAANSSSSTSSSSTSGSTQ